MSHDGFSDPVGQAEERIILKIAPGGATTIEVKGVLGPTCTRLTEALEREGKLESRELTHEYEDGGDAVQQIGLVR